MGYSLTIQPCECQFRNCPTYTITIDFNGNINQYTAIYIAEGRINPDPFGEQITIGCYQIIDNGPPNSGIVITNYSLESDCPKCFYNHQQTPTNKEITLKNCQTQEVISFIIDSDSTIVQTFTDLIGKIITIRNCVGCFEVLSIEDTDKEITNEPYLLKQYEQCSDCVKTYLVPQYEKQGYNYRNEYYPELNYKCDINIIDDIISRFTKWMNIKSIQKNLKILTNKIKEFDRRLFESKIKYLTLKYNIEDEYSCSIDKGTCCPPCILEWREIVYNICNVTDLSVDITPTICNQVNIQELNLLNCQQITMVSPNFQFGQCYQVNIIDVQLL